MVCNAINLKVLQSIPYHGLRKHLYSQLINFYFEEVLPQYHYFVAIYLYFENSVGTVALKRSFFDPFYEDVKNQLENNIQNKTNTKSLFIAY